MEGRRLSILLCLFGSLMYGLVERGIKRENLCTKKKMFLSMLEKVRVGIFFPKHETFVH